MNLLYRIRFWFYNFFGFRDKTKRPKGELIFADNFLFHLSPRKWRIGQHWGILHPKRTWLYTDESCININGNLELSTKYAPKEVTHKGITYYPDFARGEIESKIKFGKGVYVFRCKIPKDGRFAVWLYGSTSEIDIIESSKIATFSNHIHWDKYKNRKSQQYNIKPGWYTFTLIWNKDLEFKINGLTIRKDYNMNLDKEMWLVLSTLVHKGEQPHEPFLIDYIKVYETTDRKL